MSDGRGHAVLGRPGGTRYFIKEYAGDVSGELEKAKRIHAIGESSGLFRAPRPFGIPDGTSLIAWEYIPGLRDLRSAFLEIRSEGADPVRVCSDFIAACGAALARIHRELPRGEGLFRRDLGHAEPHADAHVFRHAREVLEEAPCRPVYGDFACANVFASETIRPGKRPVLIDACPNLFLFTGCPTDASAAVYWDIGQFLASLSSAPVFYRAYRAELTGLRDRFLEGYSSEAGFVLDKSAALVVAADSLLCYAEYQAGRASKTSIERWRMLRHRRTAARELLWESESIHRREAGGRA